MIDVIKKWHKPIGPDQHLSRPVKQLSSRMKSLTQKSKKSLSKKSKKCFASYKGAKSILKTKFEDVQRFPVNHDPSAS
jgi:hypothetical protein